MAKADYTENEMAATLASWGVGATYGIWENALTDGYMAVGHALRSADKDGNVALPQPALAAYGTWKNLGEHPNLRARHVKDSKALQFYQDAEALERGGFDPETALLTAARIDRNDARSGLSKGIPRAEFDKHLKDYMSKGGFLGIGATETANMGVVAHTIEETASILVDVGLPADKAVKEAARIFEESHTQINGVYVNTRNKLVPPELGELSEMLIDRYAQKHGLDESELTLVPTQDGEQNWLVVNRNTMLPDDNWRDGGVFSVRDLQGEYSAAKAEEAELERQRVNSEVAKNAAFQSAKKTFSNLPFRHRVNIRQIDPNSRAYKSRQQRYGKEIYPDGGIPFYSPGREGG